MVSGVALSAAYGQSRIAVPSYSIPGDSTWNAWEAEGPGAVGLMIVNLNNGDDTTYHAAVDQAIRAARKKGVFVLGYVYTQYGKRALTTVHSRIDSVYRNYLVDGIFFDEVPTECDAANPFGGTQFQYYEELTNYVRRQRAGARLTVLNPGTESPNDCWMGITNILVNAEANGLASYQNNFTDYAWTHQYPPERFWHIVYAVSTSDMQTVIALALRRGAAWVYDTDATLPNPYDTVPSYWASEANRVMQQGVQAPFVTFWPDSSDGSGGIKAGRVAFRWHAVNGSDWRIFLDTDQNASTGYHGGGILVGADYLFEAKADGSATLSVYTGNGTNWSWSPVSANAAISFPDAGINLGQIDKKAIAPSQALNQQIRSLDSRGNTLFTSYVIPFSLNNTAFIFNVLDH
jgi:hypothetical protein